MKVRGAGLLAGLVLTVLYAVPAAGATTPCTTATGGGDWPMYGHDVANTRTQPDEHGLGPAATANLTPAWVFSTGSTGDGSQLTTTPVVSDGCVFIGSFNGYAYGLDARTGHVVWQRKLDAPNPGSGDVIVGDAGGGRTRDDLPGQRVQRALRDRARPLDRRGHLEEPRVRTQRSDRRRGQDHSDHLARRSGQRLRGRRAVEHAGLRPEHAVPVLGRRQPVEQGQAESRHRRDPEDRPGPGPEHVRADRRHLSRQRRSVRERATGAYADARLPGVG